MKFALLLFLSCLSTALAATSNVKASMPQSRVVRNAIGVATFDELADAIAEDIAGMIRNDTTGDAVAKLQQGISGPRQVLEDHHFSTTNFIIQLGYLITAAPPSDPVKAITDKVHEKLRGAGDNIETRDNGARGPAFLATLFPVTSLVKKLGLGSLSPLTIVVDALLLALLGLGPVVGKLLLNLGLIGQK